MCKKIYKYSITFGEIVHITYFYQTNVYETIFWSDVYNVFSRIRNIDKLNNNIYKWTN